MKRFRHLGAGDNAARYDGAILHVEVRHVQCGKSATRSKDSCCHFIMHFRMPPDVDYLVMALPHIG